MSELREDAWYAIGGSMSLAPGDVQPVHLFGAERVAWRDDDGESHIWHNRCIHRGMRLQYGFVDGNRLACRYHGWRFGGDGKCAYIPAHPDMTPPDDFCIPLSPSAEACGLIWTTTGSPEGPPPDLSEFAALTFCRSITIDRAPAAVESAAAGAEFTLFSGAQPGGTCSSRGIAPGLIAVEASAGDGEALVLAIQPAGAAKTHLHILAAASVADTDIPALRRHFSAWARHFRWHVENQVHTA